MQLKAILLYTLAIFCLCTNADLRPSRARYGLKYILQCRGGAQQNDFVQSLKIKIKAFMKKLFPSIFAKNTKKNRQNMSKEHLEKSFATGEANSRVQKELRSFMSNPPENCKVSVGSNIRTWVISITGADGTLYAGETYKLKMIFPKDYPSKPPSVCSN